MSSVTAPYEGTATTQLQKFARYCWIVLFYNLPVIVWGAFVRATHSGDGCGSHWPLCDGQVVPNPKNIQMMIEFTHRMMSGICGLLVLYLVVRAVRLYPAKHVVRKAAYAALFFTVVEALIGAVLVRYGWVNRNNSVARAVVLSIHLTNTLILLGALTLTATYASGRSLTIWRGQGAVGSGLMVAVLGTIALGISGAVTALGHTLYPVKDHLEGMGVGVSSGSHFLIKLHILHPLIAMAVGLYLVLMAGLVAHLRPAADVRRYSAWIIGLLVAQIGAGLINVALYAPVWMQLVHLLLADVLWIVLVLFIAAALAEDVERVEMTRPEHAFSLDNPELAKVTWRDYLALTKPRVISLLLFTTLCSMVIAAGKWPGTILFIAVAIGGYMAAGSANAINMVIDRDIDGLMKRTSKRPTVTALIPSHRALLFAYALAAGSFAILWGAANLLTASLALAGLVFYVIIYTLLLKRRTWHNIVIGGAAGAFPPLVGWAAVTGNLSAFAGVLFLIIFVWTPVHFWALSLLLKDDYAEAGVPMLPVVRGERATVIQIGLYAIVTVVISALPFVMMNSQGQRETSAVYLVGVVFLNLYLLYQCANLFRKPDRPHASALFHYSMLYLALLFVVMAIDRSLIASRSGVTSLPEQSVKISRWDQASPGSTSDLTSELRKN